MKPSVSPSLITRRAFTAGSLGVFALLPFAERSLAQAVMPSGKTVPPEVEKANVAVVNDFCAAFGRKDLAKITSLLADTCTYRETQTRPPIVGKDKVVAAIKGLLERGTEIKVIKTMALGPIVLNERDDSLNVGGGERRTFHLAAGVFFLENGKIVEWTDYLLT